MSSSTVVGTIVKRLTDINANIEKEDGRAAEQGLRRWDERLDTSGEVPVEVRQEVARRVDSAWSCLNKSPPEWADAAKWLQQAIELLKNLLEKR